MILILFNIYVIIIVVSGYQLILEDNSPVTTGSTVTLNATIVENNGFCAEGVLKFRYEDDAFPIHKFEVCCT